MRFLESKHSYESVHSNDDEVELPRSQRKSTKGTSFGRITVIVCIAVAQILALASASIAAYTFGRLQAEEASTATVHRIGNSEIRTQSTVLEYNRTYAERPSPETDAAWEAIFPPHGGFFHDKDLAPNGASLAVYHQLHCLDAIRHAYYVLLDAVNEGHNVTFSELEDYSTDWHTRHCLDFLRQMLMCNADLNLERVDLNLGGIRGFGDGREHQCVVWEDVRNWSIEHQVLS